VTERPTVSVLIPTRNASVYLASCIDSLRKQKGADVEVIVIDNGSTDGTVETAERIADVVLAAGPERSTQLNTGARDASGTFLYRVDADFIVGDGLLAAAVQECRNGSDAVVVSNISSPHVSWWARVRHFERQMYDGDHLNVAARFFTREAFAAVGGFDESLIAGEDYDIHNRLLAAGFRIGTIASSEVHLGEPRTLGEFAAKCYYYGKSMKAFLRRNGLRGAWQMSPLRPAFLRHWRTFVRNPALSASFIVLLVVKYACGAAGMVAGEFSSVRKRR
jgi:glycosyltransferase involved in cell wall biosynthesis